MLYMLGNFGGMSLADTLLMILYRLPAVFIAFSFHEFAHAYVAYRLGDSSQRISGRLTLSPFAHIDWLGLAMLVFLGMGWAKPVRVNPNGFKNRRVGMMLVSLSGPMANFLLAFVFCGIYYLCIYLGVINPALLTVIFYVYSLNTTLMIFNLLPIPPLDGYHIVETFIRIKPRWLYLLEQYGTYVLLLFVFSGISSSIIIAAQSAVMDFISGFYNIILGMVA